MIAEDADIRGMDRISKSPVREDGSGDDRSPGYCFSPLSLPSTQVSGEVTWDWSSPLCQSGANRRRRTVRSPNNTPKRAQMLRKKRAAKLNSLLSYRPPKRKLIQPDDGESIETFTTELQALTDDFKTRQENSARNPDPPKAIDKDEGTSIFNAMTQYQTKESIVQNDSEEKLFSSLEDLFDDSINDCMIKCSQQVEDKLNRVVAGTSALYQIEDDSFDDRLLSCLEEDEELLYKALDPIIEANNVESHNCRRSDNTANPMTHRNNTEAKHTNFTPKEKISHTNSNQKNFSTSAGPSNFLNVGTKSSSEAYSKKRSGNDLGIAASQSRKFFKHKSHSDTSFSSVKSTGYTNLNSVGAASLQQAVSKSSLDLTNSGTKPGSTISCQNIGLYAKSGTAQRNVESNSSFVQRSEAQVQAANSMQKNNGSLNNNNNVTMKKANTYKENSNSKLNSRPIKENGISNGQSQRTTSSQCTPAEIERKHMEAKMKLEAKRMKQLNLNKSKWKK